MKSQRIGKTAGLLIAAALAAGAASAGSLGEGLTHYYDFEKERVSKPEGENSAAFWTVDVTGRTWNAETSALEDNDGITLVAKCVKKAGANAYKDCKTPKTEFGISFSGVGQNFAGRFHQGNAPFLCPTGDNWTISFWAMREVTGDSIKHKRLLVNGTPIVGDTGKNTDYTNDKLIAPCSTNEGFGFYIIAGKVGVRLSERTNETENGFVVRSILSSTKPAWGTKEENWHNIMLIRGGTVLTLCVDGISQGTADMVAGSSVVAPSNSLYTSFKDSGQGNGNPLDELAIWNRALDKDEIKQVAGGAKPISEMVAPITEPPMATGITHYYDFETTGAPNTPEDGGFTITGRTWNAESFEFDVDPGITLVSKGDRIGGVKPEKTGFGQAYCGGTNSYARFYGANAPFLCPTGAHWTLSFWAMRQGGQTINQKRLLVNGIPIEKDDALTNATSDNTGFGFYVSKYKIGVRLSEKVGETYSVRCIPYSSKQFAWGASQENWHNVMLIRDGTALTLYVDGSVQGAAALTEGSEIVAPSNGLYTAAADADQGNKNALDDLVIWNRALTPFEIAAVASGSAPISTTGFEEHGYGTQQLKWNTRAADNNWTATSFNNVPDNYSNDVYVVSFADVADAPEDPVNVVVCEGEKGVKGLVFENAQTAYTLTGEESVSTPGFLKSGAGCVEIQSPLVMDNGPILISGGATNIAFGNLGGTASRITINGGDSPDEKVSLNFGKNAFKATGLVDVRDIGTLTITAAPEDDPVEFSGKVSVDGGVDGGVDLVLDVSGTNGAVNFTGDVSGKMNIEKKGDGVVCLGVRTHADKSSVSDFKGKLVVSKGKLVVNSKMDKCTAEKTDPVFVKSNAVIRFEGVNCSGKPRMPNDGWLLCDGGRVEIFGTNPFNQYKLPNFILTNGAALVAECGITGLGRTHNKIGALELAGSDVWITGSTNAYTYQGFAVKTLTVRGDCGISYGPDAFTNKFCVFPGGKIDVAEGGLLTFGVGAAWQSVDTNQPLSALPKTGPGTLEVTTNAFFESPLGVQAGTLRLPDEGGDGIFRAGAVLSGGAVLDISRRSEAFDWGTNLTVNAGETVKVDITGRTLKTGDRLLAWDEGTKPEGEFELVVREEGTGALVGSNLSVVKKSGGLYPADGGTLILLR